MTISYKDYLELLQPVSDQKLEAMAQQARQLTLKHFGKTILLYIPLYLGNECDNHCVYCGFGRELTEPRVSLSVAEVLNEAGIIHNKGFRHLLLVSGEKRDKVTIPYLKEIISQLHGKFESISLEIFPLETDEYQELVKAGADGLTIYQEAYNKEIYNKVHTHGAKSDYNFRLLTPERAAQAGFYRINIGTLLGLGEWEEEAALLGWHAAYLKKKHWQSQISVSFPRLQPSAAGFQPLHPVSDRQLVQMICALRIYQPSLGLVLSTREKAGFRDNLIPLGITQMSAESRTSPGGYENKTKNEQQFEVADQRSLTEVVKAIKQQGYEPVLKDWDKAFAADQI